MSVPQSNPMNNSKSIMEYFFKKDNFNIPLYQRSYNWKKGNCEKLFDDVINIHIISETQNSKKRYKKHFFGIVICLRSEYTGDLTIIDGQQRVVSVALLLAAIRDALLDGQIKSSEERLSDEIDNKLKNQNEGNIFIRLVKKDKPAYDAIIYRDIVPEEYEESDIVSNYNYFKERILKLEDVTSDQFMECLSRLYIVPVHLSNTDDDAQNVFESINSTGLNLTEGDKIRNYMLMNHSPEDQEKYYNRYWKKIDDDSFDMTLFIRSYLTAVTGTRPPMTEVYDYFKTYAEFLRTNEESFIGLFEDMLKYSRYYRYIANSDLNRISDEASSVMFRINYHGPTVVYPFLMRVVDYHESGNISKEEVVDILKIVEDYILKRALCKMGTASVGTFFRNMFNTLVKDDSGSFAERLKYTLLKQKGGARYPRDEEVSYYLRETDLYSSPTACTHALATIEHANEDTQDTLKRISGGKLTIEHIMPQVLSKEWEEHLGKNHKEIHETWLHRLGNLTLTAYNSKYSNRPYEIKRGLKDSGFRESRLWLNRIMAESDRWTEDVIKERNILLTNRFLKVMPEFESSYAPPPTERNNLDEYTLEEDNEVFTGMEIKGYVFDGNRVETNSGIEAYLKLLGEIYQIDPLKFKAFEKRIRAGPSRKLVASDIEGLRDKWKYEKISPDMWASKYLGHKTKAWLLKYLIESYDIEPGDVAFIGIKDQDKDFEIAE